MLIRFFLELRAAAVPVSLTELLTLLQALQSGLARYSVEDFYHLSRACLVKDERHFDRFDQVFARIFRGAEALFDEGLANVPPDWLRRLAERVLTEEERRRIESLGGWEELLETLRQRLREQQERHEGGNRWIGTGGTSPFGAYGYNPEGIRFGRTESRHRSAVKVWERREFRNLDDTVEIGTRNMKLALRRLRRFAREGAAELLDLEGTIDATARNAGLLELKQVPERRNVVRVLLLLDIGGSMDDHVRVCETLFSAARSEFRYLESFYFHNFIYESVWKDNRRRHTERIPTMQLMRTYGRDYCVIFVGDATMSPYEITQPGGSVEHWNQEAGAVWMQRMCAAFPRLVWLNPQPEDRWRYIGSIQIVRELVGGRMFPLTLRGLDAAIAELKNRAGLPRVEMTQQPF